MSTLQLQQQTRALNISAEKHEKLGNTLLSSWLRSSAEHFKKVYEETNRILDEMALGNYETSSHSRRSEFTKQWYAYEEEYAFNFYGLE